MKSKAKSRNRLSLVFSVVVAGFNLGVFNAKYLNFVLYGV